MLIIFLGRRGREQDGKGTKASKGIREGAGFTDHRPWDSFPKGTKFPGSWSTYSLESSVDMRHGFEQAL